MLNVHLAMTHLSFVSSHHNAQAGITTFLSDKFILHLFLLNILPNMSDVYRAVCTNFYQKINELKAFKSGEVQTWFPALNVLPRKPHNISLQHPHI
jgi:hypothetical protein